MKRPTPSPTTPPAGIDPAAAEPSTSRAVVLVRHDGWTPAKQAAFLRALAATHSVALAAREVGMSRQSAYRLRARLKGEPFDHGWDAAFACQYDRLAEAAMDRALNGVEVPHYHRGELIGTHRRFDERLTLGLLAMRAGAARQTRGPAPSPPALAEKLNDLVERIETGPETWAEEIAAEAARQAQDTAEAEAERELTEWEEADADRPLWDEPQGDGLDADERRMAEISLPERLAHESEHFCRGFREAIASSQGCGPQSEIDKQYIEDTEDDGYFGEEYEEDGEEYDDGSEGDTAEGEAGVQAEGKSGEGEFSAGPSVTHGRPLNNRATPRVYTL